MTTATHRSAPPNNVTTGKGDVDDLVDSAFGKAPAKKKDDQTVFEYLLDEAKKGFFYSPGRAISSAFANKRNPGMPEDGLELEVAQELGKSKFERAGVPGDAFRMPMDYPAERRNLTTVAAPGSITAQIQTPVDILRNKMVCAKLGAQLLNLPGFGPRGGVRVPIRNGASNAMWVSEGSAASASAATTIAIELFPSTITALTQISRRMVTSLGQPGFVDLAIQEMMTSCAVGLDTAVINGNNIFAPLGLCQNPGIPAVSPIGDTGTGGTMAYSVLEQMESLVGQTNSDSEASRRLGWVTSPLGRSQLRKTDLSGTAGQTGRYAWQAHQHCLNNEIVTCESVLGWHAISTNAVPSGLSQGAGAANLTSILYGNWNDVLINVWDSFAVYVNPFQQSLNGTVQVSVFLDCASLLRRDLSFAVCSGWAAS